MVMHEECLEGKFHYIERLREANQQKAAVHHVRQGDGAKGFCFLPRSWILELVAYKLMVMHKECLEGKFHSIERRREANQQKAAVHHVRQEQVEETYIMVKPDAGQRGLCKLYFNLFVILNKPMSNLVAEIG
ncbi:uncharacterized protein LOC115992799 isoform X1 [Quercus lobata]|uniref:uncharacterized protein LOC115992799 isoform X1 n=1 Tax=Quercus lobata TaxID=97700 RepID=UPI0012484050|nr:uncharacterized protein LOC115992799 isoform X1 [Quercus lobata]